MAEYTYKDVIIDPEDPRVEIGEEYYWSDYPSSLLLEVLEGSKQPKILIEVDNSEYPFKNRDAKYQCIIRKKEKEKKYVPFDLSKEEDRARLRGAWIRCKDAPACEQEIIMMNGLYLIIGDKFLTTKEVLVQFEFSDGSPCGRLVEEGR